MAQKRVGLFVNAATDARIEYGMAVDGHTRVKGKADSREASIIASQFLLAASDAYRLTGKPLPSGDEPDFKWTIIQPTATSIAPSPAPDQSQHKILIFGFGDANLGLSLGPDEAKALAQTLLTMCADGATN